MASLAGTTPDTTTEARPVPHSGEYFGAQRNFWWNADFIAMTAKRWSLHTCSSMLDVGCGVGHWARTLFPHLASGAKVIGVDAEAAWVSRAADMAEAAGGTIVVEELPEGARASIRLALAPPTMANRRQHERFGVS